MKIAISKGSGSEKYSLYGTWLKTANQDVELVDLNGKTPEQAAETLETVSGLLLTGGPDVHPGHYGKPEFESMCTEINAERDELELALVHKAVELQLPILGICRGLQVLNTAFGGTLIADIPTQHAPAAANPVEHRRIMDADSTHHIEVQPGSIIRRLAGTMDGVVNSAHHQAIDAIANLFTASAISPDGIVEAIEWGDATLGGKPFLLAVQWHPERMDYNSAFSMPIAKHFTNEVQAFHLLFR